MHCEGIRGVLERRDGCWRIQNEQEVRVTAALGGSRRGLDRLRALAATLNAGLVDRAKLTRLSKKLRAIAAAENMRRVWVPHDLLPAVAFACSLLPSANGSRWLAWALSARLDANLLRGHLPGPGWCTITAYSKFRTWDYDREIRWLDTMPKTFWERLDARRECCPPGTRLCLSDGPEPCLRTARMASDPSTSPRVLKRLARSSDKVVLDLVASHPRTPSGALLEIAESYGCPAPVRMRVPQNRSASSWLLRRLADSSMWQVRGLAAANPAMPETVLTRLRADDNEFVRQVVALHASTPESDLRGLSFDDDIRVRRCVASNSSCPVDVLERLLADRIGTVRAAAVWNRAAPPDLVRPRAEDRAQGVRAAVASRSDMRGDVLQALASDEKLRVRVAAAANESTPAEALESLAAAPEPHVRSTVGCNPAASLTILEVLATDPEVVVRWSVAENGSAPTKLLRALSADDSARVREALADNPSTPPKLLATLALDEFWWVRSKIASNASTPERALRALATDEDAEIRAAAARNPSSPCDLVEALASDEDYRVRADAAMNLKKRNESQEKGKEES